MGVGVKQKNWFAKPCILKRPFARASAHPQATRRGHEAKGGEMVQHVTRSDLRGA
jgi:hypothetical protein